MLVRLKSKQKKKEKKVRKTISIKNTSGISLFHLDFG